MHLARCAVKEGDNWTLTSLLDGQAPVIIYDTYGSAVVRFGANALPIRVVFYPGHLKGSSNAEKSCQSCFSFLLSEWQFPRAH